jgi:hypothetical protein
MKFSLALLALTTTATAAAVVAANPIAADMSKLIRHAHPTANSPHGHHPRLLEDNMEGEEHLEIDISGYSLRFESCQHYDGVVPDTVLTTAVQRTVSSTTRRFVTFRLCPSDTCDDTCNENYLEYIIELEDYLLATVAYQQESQEKMCNGCEEQCFSNATFVPKNNVDDCAFCYGDCTKIRDMEDNGYIDATEFLECRMVYDDGEDRALYAGPVCASNGSKINIGVFANKACTFLDPNKDVEDYLMDEDGYSMKLSHALLKTVYSDDCVSCRYQEQKNYDGGEIEVNQPDALEMCEILYGAAATVGSSIAGSAAATVGSSIAESAAETSMRGQKFAFIAALILGTAGLLITS